MRAIAATPRRTPVQHLSNARVPGLDYGRSPHVVMTRIMNGAAEPGPITHGSTESARMLMPR